jgi:hypothetical protein
MTRWSFDPHIDPERGPAFFRQLGGQRRGGGATGPGGPQGPQGPAGFGGPGPQGGFGGFGGGQQTTRQIVRLRISRVFELES